MTRRRRRALTLLAAVAAVAVAAVAWGAGGTQVEREGFRVVVPAGWNEMPDLANTIANGILGASTDIDGGAAAWGDASAGIFGSVLWVRAKKKVEVVRPELDAFHASLRASIEESGVKVTKHEVSETATRMTSRLEAETDQVKLQAVSIAAVDKKGILHGWSAQCVRSVRAPKKALPLCDALLGSFAVTVADGELKPLEKKR